MFYFKSNYQKDELIFHLPDYKRSRAYCHIIWKWNDVCKDVRHLLFYIEKHVIEYYFLMIMRENKVLLY